MTTIAETSPFLSRVLIVNDRDNLGPLMQRRYPGVDVALAPTYLSAIAELANGPVHAVFGFVEPTFGALSRAVRGLRRAAGEEVPVVLCCEPEGEPLARRALEAGASEYVIWPPEAGELDRALHLKSDGGRVAATPASSLEEIGALADVVAELSGAPHRLPRKVAEFVRLALGAACVEVSLERSVKRVGPKEARIVLRQPIEREGESLGEIALGPALSGAYTARQLDRLRAYAGLLGHLVAAARQQQHWQHLAMTDDLTHLPNRRYLMKFLRGVLERAGRERFRVTVCMFDIDDFKEYNDRFGHATGDSIIKAMSQLFLRHCRVEDVVARYGGDEFVVVFWDAESPRVAGSEHPDAATRVMRRFQESLKSYEFGCLGPKGKGVLTVSGGLATYPWHATTSADLLKRAGLALLEAKRSGKDQIHVVGDSAGS